MSPFRWTTLVFSLLIGLFAVTAPRSARSDGDACELVRELRCEVLASGMTQFRDDEDIGRAGCLDAGADRILAREGMADDAGCSRSDRLLDDEPAGVRDVRDLEVTQHVAKVRQLVQDS